MKPPDNTPDTDGLSSWVAIDRHHTRAALDDLEEHEHSQALSPSQRAWKERMGWRPPTPRKDWVGEKPGVSPLSSSEGLLVRSLHQRQHNEERRLERIRRKRLDAEPDPQPTFSPEAEELLVQVEQHLATRDEAAAEQAELIEQEDHANPMAPVPGRSEARRPADLMRLRMEADNPRKDSDAPRAFKTIGERSGRPTEYKKSEPRPLGRACAEPVCTEEVVGRRNTARYCPLHSTNAAKMARRAARRRGLAATP